MKKFTTADLAENDGKEGRRAYVAFEGRVYDVSGSNLWPKGSHMTEHQAGADLSDKLSRAPHGKEVFENVRLVGELIEKPRKSAKPLPAWSIKLLSLHPHPIFVHFPQAFFTFAPVFLGLAYFYKLQDFERTSFFILTAGMITALPAYATGFFHWYYRFGAKWNFYFRFKMIVSPVLLLIGATALALHAARGPLPVERIDVPVLVLQLLLLPIVVSLGYVGGKIVFSGGK